MKVSDNNRNVSAIDILGSNLKSEEARIECYNSATTISQSPKTNKRCRVLRRVICAVIANLLFALGAYSEPVQGELAMPIEERTTEKDNKEFISFEQFPRFPDGGDSGLLKWVQSNLKYPEIAKKNGVQGRVHVQFVVNEDGSIGDVKVVRSVEPTLDEEAIRIVKTFPNFIPAKLNTTPIKCWYTLPINFKLPEAEK